MLSAVWITTPEIPDMLPDTFKYGDRSVYFRHEFTLNNVPAKAVIKLCVLGLGVCNINGTAVTDDVLTTPFTAYDKRVIYRTFDVTKLLKQGKNAIGIHAGNGFYNSNMRTWNDCMAPWRDKPKAIAELCITFADGSNTVVCSSKDWRTALGPCLYNQMRQGEIFDANLIQKGYDSPCFDDTKWAKVKLAHAPGGVLSDEETTPIRITETLKPVSVKDGVYDFGVNISGWVKIKLNGIKGQTIGITYGEAFKNETEFTDESRTFTITENLPLHAACKYICSGEKGETYAPTFCYFGFRYVKIDNAPDGLEVEAQFVHTAFDTVGRFECSDGMLNKLHDASVRAIKSNFVGIPTDCPHREQNGWTGDALFSIGETLLNFDATDAYRKWLRDFIDVQRPSGQLPGIVPCAGWGYNWGSGPAWDSAFILIPYTIYTHTKNTDIIKELWQNMALYMSYFESMADGYIADFGLGDWCPVDTKDVCPTAITDTAYLFADAVAMSRMARLIGKDSSHWDELALKVKAAWKAAFWQNKTYEHYQTYWACAVYQGLLDADEAKYASSKLAELVAINGYHINCGVLGAKYIFDALSDYGYADVAYKMATNPTYPSYAYWINSGMTTLCETWNMNSSLNHHMFSEIDDWLYRHVAGIEFGDDGLVIAPKIIDGIDWVKAAVRGVSIERQQNRISLVIDRQATLLLCGKATPLEKGNYYFTV